jgi:hypothetical protein
MSSTNHSILSDLFYTSILGKGALWVVLLKPYNQLAAWTARVKVPNQTKSRIIKSKKNFDAKSENSITAAKQILFLAYALIYFDSLTFFGNKEDISKSLLYYIAGMLK